MSIDYVKSYIYMKPEMKFRVDIIDNMTRVLIKMGLADSLLLYSRIENIWRKYETQDAHRHS